MALSGDDINFNDKNVWSKYRPHADDITACNPYFVTVKLRCPWNCSTADMRRFKWIGYDLIIGYGQPNPKMEGGNGYFLGYNNSFVIDGFHNLDKINIDSKNAGDYVSISTYFRYANDSLAIKDEYNNDMYIDYNGRKKLTWALVKTIMKESAAFYIRPWVRSRGISDSKPHSTSGYLYGGYDDFSQPGKKGHTFNNGLLVQTSRPQIRYINHRINEQEDGSMRNSVTYEISLDPYYYIRRGPSDGTISQTGGAVKYKKRFRYTDYQYKIQIYAKGRWDSGAGSKEQLVHEEIVKIGDIDNPSGSWAPWRKQVTVNIVGWNTIDIHQNAEILSRVQSYIKCNWDDFYGPIDNGFSVFGWNGGIGKKISGGSTYEFVYSDVYYAILNDLKNNRIPTYNKQLSVSIPPRKDGALNTEAVITVQSNLSDPDGDGMEMVWLGRNYYPVSQNKPHNSNDVALMDWQTVTSSNKTLTIKANDFLNKLKTVVNPADRQEIGIEFGYRDLFVEGGITKSCRYRWSGVGWTGWRLEYPVTNLRVAVTNATSAHNAVVNGEQCVVMRNINAEIFYDTPRGDDGAHHSLELNKQVPGAADRSGSIYIIGTWYGFDDWTNRLTLPSTRKASTDIYALFGSNNANRGCFYKFFCSMTTPGGWSYDKGWSYGNDRSAVVFLNKFPRCVMNSATYGPSANIVMNFTITDSFFNLKTVHVDLVIPSLGKVIRVYDENVQSQNTKTVSRTATINATQYIRNAGVDPNSILGKTIEVHSHGENIYDFSQTWDGTRVGAGEWSKAITYDRDPITNLSVDRTKGEQVVIRIRKDTTYTARVRATVKVKKSGESDSALKTLWTDVVLPADLTWNPATTYAASYRGATFEFKYDVKTDYGFSWSNLLNDARWFQWNEVPTIQMPSLGFGKDNTSGNSINQINGRWGERVTTYTKCMDPDQKNVDYSIRYNNKDTRVAHYDNIGVNTVDHNSTVSAQQLDDEYKRVNGSYLYPINLDLDMFSIAQCNDPYGQYSPAVSSGGFKLLSTERRSGYGYSATSDSQKVGDIVYGLSIILQFNMTIINSAKFSSTTYRRRHFICAREIGTSTEFWVFSTEEYPTKTNDECWYYGTDDPGTVKIRVAVGNNGDRFKPGKQYEFRVYTTVQKRGDDSSKIYENNSGWFGKFMYGTYPDKATVLYPNSTQQPMRNPPIIIQIPAQSNVSNSEISDIGVFINDTFYGWNHADNNNWIANPQTNYANKTVVFNWSNGLGRGQVVNVRFRIKSKLTGLTADTQNYPVNINSNSYIKSQGNIVDGLTDAKDGINALRRAYGMANYSYPSTGNGVPITFANHLQCMETAFNEWAAKVRGYGTPAANLSISNGVFILAQSTTTVHNQITEFKK